MVYFTMNHFSLTQLNPDTLPLFIDEWQENLLVEEDALKRLLQSGLILHNVPPPPIPKCGLAVNQTTSLPNWLRKDDAHFEENAMEHLHWITRISTSIAVLSRGWHLLDTQLGGGGPCDEARSSPVDASGAGHPRNSTCGVERKRAHGKPGQL